MLEEIDIDLIHENETNPRTISEQNLLKLQRSLEEFPEMLFIRPIVVDENNIIIGGNMRYKAAKLNGLKKVWISRVELSTDKKKEFIIKDNTSAGQWDFTKISTDFDKGQITKWGLMIPEWYNHEQDLDLHELPEHRKHGYGTKAIILEFTDNEFQQVNHFIKSNKIKLDLYIKSRL